MIEAIPVFYRDEMVADIASYSPSAAKPAAVHADWCSSGLPIASRTFEPVSEATLSLAHDPIYVRGILSGTEMNGFGNCSAKVARSLPYTSGAMLAAARGALANRCVACAPVSGFHHACFDHAEGYCTFNGLMVTALALKHEGAVQRVGILDLDHHFGNGTVNIIQRTRASWVHHHSSGLHSPEAKDARPYLDRLANLVSTFMDCDILLYQAGADAHVNDPLGGWMTTEELLERDRIVFEMAASLGLPVAWNLAGGYQKDDNGGIPAVLEVHRNTMLACAEVFSPCTRPLP